MSLIMAPHRSFFCSLYGPRSWIIHSCALGFTLITHHAFMNQITHCLKDSFFVLKPIVQNEKVILVFIFSFQNLFLTLGGSVCSVLVNEEGQSHWKEEIFSAHKFSLQYDTEQSVYSLLSLFERTFSKKKFDWKNKKKKTAKSNGATLVQPCAKCNITQ